MKKSLVPTFRAMNEIRVSIYKLCELGKCPVLGQCKKYKTVCKKEKEDNKRRLVSASGGRFVEYIQMRNSIIESNMALVIRQARGIGCPSKFHEDLIQEGYLGLIKAVERFDLTMGNRFSTYAYGHIRKMLLKYIRMNAIVRRKGQARVLVSSIHRAFDRLVQKIHTGEMQGSITAKRVVEQMQSDREHKGMADREISLPAVEKEVNDLIMEFKYSHVREPLGAAQVTEQQHGLGFYAAMNKKLEEDFMKIPVFTAEALKLRFGLGDYDRPATLKETACALGVTKQAVHQTITRFFQTRKIAWDSGVLEEPV